MAEERVWPAPHAESITEVLQRSGTDQDRGLSDEEVRARQAVYGSNELGQAPTVPWWQRLVRQFRGPLVLILIAAAIVATALGEGSDAIVILAIVVLNAAMGFVQEEKAAHALEALRTFTPPLAKVLRDGVKQVLDAREIVPGDIVELEAGDIVPADGRLISSYALRTQEAPLTGESEPVAKDDGAVLPASAALAERRNMVFQGTHVSAGKTSAVVVATGLHTELGQIAGLLKRLPRQPTPLEQRLAELGRILIVVCLAMVAVIFVLQLMRGGDAAEVFFLAVSLAVAAVPEGLPAVVTICLALGLQRMARRNSLVRKLHSVETLGSVTVICSDKTGTLTRDEMTVERALTGSREWRATGSGYHTDGEFQLVGGDNGRQSRAPTDDELNDLRWMLTIASYCNNAVLLSDEKDRPRSPNCSSITSNASSSGAQIIGDPTEAALLVAARKAGLNDRAPSARTREIPFASDRRLMSVVVNLGHRLYLFTKGAPEDVLDKCSHEYRLGRVEPITPPRKAELAAVNATWAGAAMRVLGLAYRQCADVSDTAERELVFAGLVAMRDPPRTEAKEAVARCHAAGVRVVMITGDHPRTAGAIARQLSVLADEGRVLTGGELDELSGESLREAVRDYNVYARATADAKLRIVRALKAGGQIVAMTGDGVNDAPAVQLADIGIAMGITGTDVTKAAADLVLVDDNFATIVNAIEEGRGIFDNIQKIVHYLLSCNSGEVLFMFFASLIGWPLPLEAIQILWINLVTDGMPALALALEPPESDVMRRPPRLATEGVLTFRGGIAIALHGALIAASTAGAFWWTLRQHSDPQIARTTAFCVLGFSQLLYSFGCRSRRSPFFKLRLWSNPSLYVAIAASLLLQVSIVFIPALRQILRVSGPKALSWLLIASTSLIPITVTELLKLVASTYSRIFPTNAHDKPAN